MSTEAEELARRIAGLKAFYEANRDLGLKNPNVWTKESGVSYNSVNEALTGAKVPNIKIGTLENLADGASRLLGRPVTIDEIIGRDAPTPELDVMADKIFNRMTVEQKREAISLLVQSLSDHQT